MTQYISTSSLSKEPVFNSLLPLDDLIQLLLFCPLGDRLLTFNCTGLDLDLTTYVILYTSFRNYLNMDKENNNSPRLYYCITKVLYTGTVSESESFPLTIFHLSALLSVPAWHTMTPCQWPFVCNCLRYKDVPFVSVD